MFTRKMCTVAFLAITVSSSFAAEPPKEVVGYGGTGQGNVEKTGELVHVRRTREQRLFSLDGTPCERPVATAWGTSFCDDEYDRRIQSRSTSA